MSNTENLLRLGGLDLSPGPIQGWARRGLDRLLPFQERVVRDSALCAGGDLLLIAPASSGKTLLAEIALVRALELGRRAIYLVPTKALAEEKYAVLSDWLGPAGYRVVCATRDRPETDRRVIAGEFDLLVVVYEKMNHFVLVWPEVLAGVSTLVVDEIQMLGDGDRGALLDLLLTKLRLSPYDFQLVALAPEVADPDALARWLGCELRIDRLRPRELREGVLDASTGIFHYRTSNGSEDGVEALADPAHLESLARELAEGWLEEDASEQAPEIAMLAVAACLAIRAEQLLVFAPTRHSSRLWADRLASIDLGAPAAGQALARIALAEPSRAGDLLAHCLGRGVAFHNSDLHASQRGLIEESFNRGELRAIVSTATLGLGVNLAARNVLHYPWRVGHDPVTRRPYTTGLGRSRFANQGGRAARLGLGEGEGRSLLVARSKHEANRFWTRFVLAPPEPIESPLARAPVGKAVLDLLAGPIKRTTENLERALGETFSARASKKSLPSKQIVAEGLEACAKAGLVRQEPESGLWSPTGLGESAARAGISISTAAVLRRAVEQGLLAEATAPFDLFLLLALTEDGREAAGSMPAPSRLLAGALAGWLARGEGECAVAHRVFSLLGSPGGPARDDVKAYFTATILTDWIEGLATDELERKHNVFCGAVAGTAAQFAWLLGALGAVADLLGEPPDRIQALRSFAERLPLGIRADAIPVARLRVPDLGRTAIARLTAEGLDSAEALATADPFWIGELLGPDLAARAHAAARRIFAVEERKRIAAEGAARPAPEKPGPDVRRAPPKPNLTAANAATPMPIAPEAADRAQSAAAPHAADSKARYLLETN